MLDRVSVPNIIITESARAHFSKVVYDKIGGILLSLKKYGCNGWAYEVKLVDFQPENTLSINYTDFFLYVDLNYLDKLQDLSIDWVEQGLGQNHLVFQNKKTKEHCGCGESFVFDS